MKKMIAMLLIVLSVISIFGITVAAVEPRWNNAASAIVSLEINNNGIATVALNCAGIPSVTSIITADTKIERKWGILWLDVDGAEWIDTTTNVFLSTGHSIQLSKTGTYRATTKFTVSGTGGSNDSIKCTSECTYE